MDSKIRSDYQIRPAAAVDLPAIREICLKTADAGGDGTALFQNPELLWAVYADPYLVYSPKTCFVAADKQGVCGYILAALDSAAMQAWALKDWLPTFQKKYPMKIYSRLNENERELLQLIHSPLPLLPWTEPYPSHLHIDILPRAQRRGLGRKLIKCLMQELTVLGSSGVHFWVAGRNQNAQDFYHHIGFEDLLVLPDNTRLMGFKLPGREKS